MPKIDVLKKSQYLLAPNELELELWTIGKNPGPPQSLKFSSSKSLQKISYTTCNRHQIFRPCRATKDHAKLHKKIPPHMQDCKLIQDAPASFMFSTYTLYK